MASICNNKGMGFQFGLEANNCFKRRYRWMFAIRENASPSIEVIPCITGSRPSLQFKETAVETLYETLWYPTKPDWKPITIVFFDLKKDTVPFWDWINSVYDTKAGIFRPIVGKTSSGSFKKTGILELYDGCGNVLESWIIDNIYPQNIDYDELDMGSSELVNASVTFRYDRAYLITANTRTITQR